MAEKKWRIKVTHNCDSERLREAALARMRELVSSNSQVKVEHVRNEDAGIDIARANWMGQEIYVVVSFHPALALVGIRLPHVLMAFRKTVEARVREEIKSIGLAAGGVVSDIQDVISD